jgi:hypothetical protein
MAVCLQSTPSRKKFDPCTFVYKTAASLSKPLLFLDTELSDEGVGNPSSRHWYTLVCRIQSPSLFTVMPFIVGAKMAAVQEVAEVHATSLERRQAIDSFSRICSTRVGKAVHTTFIDCSSYKIPASRRNSNLL